MWISLGRVFQEEQTANTKALGWICANMDRMDCLGESNRGVSRSYRDLMATVRSWICALKKKALEGASPPQHESLFFCLLSFRFRPKLSP